MSNGLVSSDAAKTGTKYANTAQAPVAQSKAVLSAAGVEQLIAAVRASVYQELERQQALVDGVTLAAEQVQDKRIELLESPPPIKGGELFVSVLLTVALESNLVGKIVASCTKKVLLATLKRDAVFRVLPKSKAGRDMLSLYEGLGQAGTDAVSVAERQFGQHLIKARLAEDVKSESLLLYNKHIANFVTSESSELIPLAKGARVAVDELRKKRVPALAVSDTDATTLRAAAIDYASNHRAYTLSSLAQFESLIRSTRVLKQDVETLKNVFGPENLDLTPLQIRNEVRLLFEAVIWARLYNFKPNVGPTVQVLSSKGSIDGVDDRLTQYWQVRFAEAVKRWRRETGKSDPMDYDFQPAGVKSTWLKEYFWAIVQKTPAGGFATLQK